MNFIPQGFNNYGYVRSVVPSFIKEYIEEEIAIVSKDSTKAANQGLAGHLSREYKLTDSIPVLEPFLIQMAENYDYTWNYSKKFKHIFRNFNEIKSSLHLESLWVNLQKKYEFNPMHNHTGIYSFVCWLNIPYDLKEEFEMPHVKSVETKKSSLFEFSYTNIFGEINSHEIFVDKTFEGTIILFPAELKHTVYPFYTSDDYRISISGNLTFKT
jgi:hypothetical protein